VHSTLLAADALRDKGDDDAAAKRLDQAARVSTGDVRAAVARAVRALGRRETASPALRLGDAPELAPLTAAIGACLRCAAWSDLVTARLRLRRAEVKS